VTTEIVTSINSQQRNLARLGNSFEEENHVQCFYHTLQLSANALMSPLHPAFGQPPDLYDYYEYDPGVKGEDDDDEEDVRQDVLDISEVDDDKIDELDYLDDHSREKLIEDTAVVRSAISKLCRLAFWATRSVALWHCYCRHFYLEPRIFPGNITRWNLTLDMLNFALDYHRAIDAVTTDKTWMLKAYQLKDEEWQIVGDLVVLLEVATVVYYPLTALTLLQRNTKTKRSISPKILLVLQRLSLL
jgi:hypothetical protein